MAPSDLAIRFARTYASQVFPTLIWFADLVPDLFTPLNEAIRAKLDAITGPRVQSELGIRRAWLDAPAHRQHQRLPIKATTGRLAAARTITLP